MSTVARRYHGMIIVAGSVSSSAAAANTFGAEGSAAPDMFSLTAILMLIGGFGIGCLFALFSRHQMATRLKKLSEDVTELADGNLDFEIETSDRIPAIKLMQQTLSDFQQKALEVRQQKSDAKQKKEADKQRDEEQRRREAERAEEQRRVEEADRNEERKRLDAMERLQTDAREVLGKAATGNFSVRMPRDIPDPDTAKLSNVINDLLDLMETNVAEVVASVGELAKGNLGVRISGTRHGVFLNLKEDFNAAVVTLSETMATIIDSGASVSETSSNLKKSSGEMASRAESNAATAEETSAAVEQITASIRQVVENAKAADQATQRVRESADHTRKVSTKTEASINEMTEASAQINRVVKVIEDIAFQINLLALNAGVEAARAGEAGLGFSVVASEVRALALRSQEAVQEITEVIQQSNRSVESGVEQVGLSREALEGIIKEVEVASGQISEIASAVEEQAKGIEEINGAIRTIDMNAQKNAATIEEMTASSISLSDEADQLSSALHQFKGVQATGRPKPLQRTPTTTFKHSEPVRPQTPKLASVAGNNNNVFAEDDGWDEF